MKTTWLFCLVLLSGFCMSSMPAQAVEQQTQQADQWYDVDVQARFDDAIGMVYFDIWYQGGGGRDCEVEIIVNDVSYFVTVVGSVDGALQLPGCYSWNTNWSVGKIRLL